MAARRKKGKPASGGARLAAAGRRPMLIGWLPDQREKIQAAATADGRSMTQFVMFHALKSAEKILAESGKSY